jgi:cytochrome P450
VFAKVAKPLPAGPRGHFLLGHLVELGRDPLGALQRYAREYGDFVPLRFGPKRAVLLNHPDYVEQVLATHSRYFIKSPALRNSRRLIGHGLLASEGELWRRQRRLIQPAFHRPQLAAYSEIMVACTEQLLATWRDGEVRDVHQEMMRLTLQIVARALFGADVTDEAAVVDEALRVALERFGTRLSSLAFLLPDTLPTPDNWGFLRAARRLDAIVYRIIAARRASGVDRGDLLSILLRARDEADGGGMTDKQLHDEVMTLLLAGHETTAIALSWTWYLLAQHPAVEAKLLAELQAVLGGRAPTVEDLPQLPYTEWVLWEALRLYPPAWALAREAVQDCEIGGYPVPAGTIVVMSQWLLHRDPRYFDEPERFLPERWADGLAKRLPRYAYFPFGGGPRLCIGAGFASLEAALVLATVLPRFRLTLVPEHPIALWPSATLRPRYGIRMVLHRR